MELRKLPCVILTGSFLFSAYRSSSSRDRGERDRDRFDRLERRDSREDRDRGLDRARVPITKRSFSRESEERARGVDVRRVASMTDERDRGSRDRTAIRETTGNDTVLFIHLLS